MLAFQQDDFKPWIAALFTGSQTSVFQFKRLKNDSSNEEIVKENRCMLLFGYPQFSD